MLMVDLILNLDANFVETIFLIKEDNIFVNNGIFIEAGLIENTAQTCSSIVGKKYFSDDGTENESINVIGFISALKNLKIHSLPKVNDSIRTKANLVSKFIGDDYTLCTMSCESLLEDKILLECEINLFIQKTISTIT